MQFCQLPGLDCQRLTPSRRSANRCRSCSPETEMPSKGPIGSRPRSRQGGAFRRNDSARTGQRRRGEVMTRPKLMLAMTDSARATRVTEGEAI